MKLRWYDSVGETYKCKIAIIHRIIAMTFQLSAAVVQDDRCFLCKVQAYSNA